MAEQTQLTPVQLGYPSEDTVDTSQLNSVISKDAPGAIATGQTTQKPVDAITDQLGIKLTPVPDASPQEAIRALKTLTEKQTEQMDITSKAASRNQAVLDYQQQLQSEFDNDSIDALGNLEKIQRWSGLGGGVTKILGLFDSDWNPEVQKTRIQINSAKSDALATRAKTQMEINNIAPTMAAAATTQAQDIFNSQMKIVDIAQKFADQGMEVAKTKVAAVDAWLHLKDEDRKTTEQQLLSMTPAQLTKNITDANAGKGDWVGKVGLLLNRQMTEEKGAAELEKAQDEAAKGREDLANFHFENVAYHAAATAPITFGQLIQKALDTNQAFLSFNSEGKSVNIPIANAIAGYKRAQEEHDGMATAILSHDQQQVGNAFDRTMQSATTLAASGSREAAAEVGLLTTMRQRLDPNNPESLTKMRALVDMSNKRIQSYADNFAKQYKTPEAQAAVKAYVENGSFSDVGATAVLNDVIGVPNAGYNTKYAPAFQIYQTALANKLAEQNIAGAPALDASNPTSIRAYIQAMASGRVRIRNLEDMKNEVLHDQSVNTQARGIIETGVQQDMFRQTLQHLAGPENKTSGAMWTQITNMLANHDPSLVGDDGSFPNYSKLAWYLAQRSVETGNKINYGQVFADALQQQALANRNGNPNDPQMTVADRALEMALYGGSPYGSAAGDVAGDVRKAVQNAQQQMTQAIQRDQSGAAAIDQMRIDAAYANPGEMPPINWGAVPSATGVGTVESIRKMFGGGASQPGAQ